MKAGPCPGPPSWGGGARSHDTNSAHQPAAHPPTVPGHGLELHPRPLSSLPPPRAPLVDEEVRSSKAQPRPGF